jgi:fructoselysine-6-P-deglycase FrlB-like protein
MSHVADEIASQPELWLRAGSMAASLRDELPMRGARVAVVGCGTSLFMARSWAALRESAGHGETDAYAASEFPNDRRYDHVVAITRSGTTTEVVRLVQSLTVPTTVLTADGALPAGAAADHVVELRFADERSVVQTRFATCALALLRASLGESLESAAADARGELATPLADELLGRRQYTFLGTGWTVGLADEAALKLREAAQAWAESYPAMEYRHGPISIAAPDTAVWIFGAPPPALLDEIGATGASVVTSDGDPMAQLVRAQRVAVALAEQGGRDPDAPRNLTRSVVLS